MTIKDRIQAPTPSFFKKVRNIGLTLATISVSILTAPVTLPAVLIKVAGYLGVGAAVASAVSQSATYEKKKNGKQL